MNEQFHIWKGNVKIDVANGAQMGENVDKFQTCQHRSPEEQDIRVKTCCSSIKRRGFVCLKRQIDFLSPSVCGPCHLYEPKTTPNEGTNPS